LGGDKIKYSVGDKVILHSKKWVKKHCNFSQYYHSYTNPEGSCSYGIIQRMVPFLGKTCTISRKSGNYLSEGYKLEESSLLFWWEEWMISDKKTNKLRKM